MGKTIQVCDDDAGVRDVLVRLFSTRYEVIEASGGREALTQIEEHCPDLVILDMSMPGMSGLETLEAYHKAHPHLATVVLTGDQEPEVARRALELGAHSYITKPFEARVLLEEVQSLLDTGAREANGPERPPWRHKPDPSA